MNGAEEPEASRPVVNGVIGRLRSPSSGLRFKTTSPNLPPGFHFKILHPSIIIQSLKTFMVVNKLDIEALLLSRVLTSGFRPAPAVLIGFF